MEEEKLDLHRKLEPVSRVLRALGIPPIEAVIILPREILDDLGIPKLEDVLPKIKDDIRAKLREIVKK